MTSKASTRLIGALRWTWRRISTLIAILLIALALYVGYRIGAPAAPPPDHDHETTAATTEPDTGPARMYTCSMHPSVRLPDPDAKCPICFMDLIPVSADENAGPEARRRISLPDSAVKLADIQTTRVARFFPTARTRLYAKLAEDETRVARVTAWFPGRLEDLHIDYVGVPLLEGDHIAEIYSPELLAAFEELRQARRAVEQQTDASPIVRETTRQTLEAAREKLRLFGLTPEQIERAQQRDPDDDTFTIYSPIPGVVTHLAVREGDYVKTGSPIATVADLSHLWLMGEAYESDLPLLRWGQRVSFTVQSLPGETFEGRISFIDPRVDPDTRAADVRIAVNNESGRLKPGMFATVVASTKLGVTAGPGREATVVISDELAGMWVCRMHPEVISEAPGDCDVCAMPLVRAEALGAVGEPDAVAPPLVIPTSAALITGTRAVVYVRLDDTEKPTFEGREIVLGPRAGDFYIVESGLREGEHVVTNGAFKIDSAMQIAAKPSMMSPEGGAPAPGHDHGAAGRTSPQERAEVPDHFVHSLKPLYAAYLDAQAALADDELGSFRRAVADLRIAVSIVDTAGVTGENLGAWRRAIPALKLDPEPENIQDAREAFKRMSDAVIRLLHRFGHRGSDVWYLAHCPMAFDNAGADWVQRSDTIDNPYFGAAMLRCGEIRAEFHPLDHVAREEAGSHE